MPEGRQGNAQVVHGRAHQESFTDWMTKPNIKIWLPMLVLLASAGGAWAIMALRPEPKMNETPATIPEVEVVRVAPQTVQLNVISQGIVKPRLEIDLVTEVAGKVVHTHPSLVAGGFFAKNDLLLTIDPRNYDYAVVTARAKVAAAKRALLIEQAQAEQAESEWKALGDGEANDLALHKPQLAEAEASLRAAEAELTKAKLDRSRCELRAPFAGRVLSKNAGIGQYLTSGTVAARIASTDSAEIRLPIGVEELAFLDLPLVLPNAMKKAWPKVTLSANMAGKRQSWQGKLIRTEAGLDSDSGQLIVVAEVEWPYRVPSGQSPLLSGLFVEANIEGVRRDDLMVLPRTAVNSLQQVKLVDAEQRLTLRRVDVLRADRDRAIVASGLEAGDRVIVSEMPVPVEGMQVRMADPGTQQTQ